MTARKRFLSFKRHLRAEINEGEGAYLFSERGVIAMRGADVAEVAALLDGTRDFEGLVRDVPAGLGSGRIAGVLARLAEAGLITVRAREAPETDGRALAFWDACGVDAGAAESRIRPARVVLAEAREGIESERVGRALRAAGLTVGTHAAGEADLSVVLCDDYLDPGLGDIDAAHRSSGRPWLLARPVGSQVWLGPFFEPGESACWHCLADRLWTHRHGEACVQAMLGHDGPAARPVSAPPPLASAAAHLIALEVAKWLSGYRYLGQRCVWVLDSLDLRGERHELRRRPQCPACGDASLVAARTAEPVVLRPTRKAAHSGDGHRALAPGEMFDRYRHLIGPVTGVVKEIVRDARSPAFVNACRSGPNVVRNLTGMDSLHASLRGQSGGKGATPAEAEVGALCEAVERHSGNYRGDELRLSGSLRSLGPDAIHPNECMLYAAQQYENRAEWNAAHGSFQHVCREFDADAELDWTPLWSLSRSRQRLLPTGLLYFGAPDPHGFLRPDSNGNAAGSSVEDAVLQGTLEVIERDAVALWWYNRTPMPGVDLAAFGDPWVEEMTAQYAEAGREVWALDLTSDLGVPVMAAVSRALSGPERVIFGFGAHLDPRTALRRAVSELNQMLPGVLDLRRDDDPDVERWLSRATAANQPYLKPAAGTPARTRADFGYLPNADIRDDVAGLVRLLGRHGMETLVLDQTRPDVELPVVKVVVPGLRSFWARFAPGRLFDVPVRLGRLSRPTARDRLNPFPMFL
ncbi:MULTISPECIES: TOMM precursor leader peptide-binding protein [Amycolatopsis]|nr:MULTISPECIES: TOMM precursor leader peptide-binding protein [Amycolatopsis]